MAEELEVTIDVDEDDFDFESTISDVAVYRKLKKRLAAYRDQSWGSSLGEQLDFGGGHRRDFLEGELASLLRAAIPEDKRSADFIDNVDLRVLLNAVAVDASENADNDDKITINGVETTMETRAAASLFTIGATQQLASEAEQALLETGADPRQVAEIVSELRQSHQDGVGRRIPTIGEATTFQDPETGELVSSGDGSAIEDQLVDGAFDFSFDAAELEVGVSETRFLTPDEVREMMEISDDPLSDLERRRQYDDAISLEREAGGRVGGDPTSVQVVNRVPTRGELPGGAQLQNSELPQPTNGGAYTLNETLKLPNELGREELLRLQTRMKEAGIFDLVGGNPTLNGDPTDPRFKRAWRMAVTMSLQTGDSVTKVIADRRQARMDALGGSAASAQAAAATLLTDPARIRTSANTIAAAEIGRRLSPEEQEELVTFVHDLERRNAAVQAARAENEAAAGEAAAGELDQLAEGGEVTAAGEHIDKNFADSDADIAAANARADATASGSSIERPDGMPDLDERVIADINAQMEEFVRADNPLESEGHDAAQQYETFSRLLAGPGRGVGR